MLFYQRFKLLYPFILYHRRSSILCTEKNYNVKDFLLKDYRIGNMLGGSFLAESTYV